MSLGGNVIYKNIDWFKYSKLKQIAKKHKKKKN